MNILTNSGVFTKTITLCGVAALMLTTAPIMLDDFVPSSAQAQGQGGGGNSGGGGNDSGGGSDRGSDRGGGNSNQNQGENSGGTDNNADSTSSTTPSTQSSGGAAQGGTNAASGSQSGNSGSGNAAVSADPQVPSDGGQSGGSGSGPTFSDIILDMAGASVDEDSDRPDWAGEPGGKDGAGGGQPDTSGTTKGDLYGDLFIIARDANGVPILTAEGWVQPLDADGNPIALDEDGHPLDESLTQEVELGRLNVSRAPVSVLDNRAHEVIDLMLNATDLTTDAAGRLVFTLDGVTKTIDSPLENLAIYTAIITTGTIPGVDDLPGTEFDFLVDGQMTDEDLAASAVFLAAATDKTGVFTSDEIAYLNAFLGVNTQTVGSVIYSDIDYSDFTYSREDTYQDVTAEVLVLQEDGSWVPTVVNVYDAVFESEEANAAGSLDAYTVAADDARSIVNYIHEYEVPAVDLDSVTH
ncbi:hypothetical protein [Yoonia sp. SDW83-1]|uniref:hypothetical protein n=1 Tax=Yoonia sp. SDW83-1 TaxID=3366945 RepID=UPI00398C77FA